MNIPLSADPVAEKLKKMVSTSGAPVMQADRFVWRDAAQALPILNRATEVIGEKGFGQASLRMIAKEGDFSSAAVYYYFRNKEELLFAIIRRGLQGVIDSVKQAVQSVASPEEKLFAVIFGSLAYHIDNFNEFKVLFKESNSLEGEYAEEAQRLRDDYVAIVNQVIDLQYSIKSLQDSTLVHDAWRERHVYYLIGLVSWTVMNRRRIQSTGSEALEVEILARELCDLYLNGMLFETHQAHMKKDQ